MNLEDLGLAEVVKFQKNLYFYFTIYNMAITDQSILLQLQQMPDNLKQEVLDFIGYLSEKHKLPAVKPQMHEKKQFGKYRGSLKTGMSLDEIDTQLLQLRNEWERPIS